MQLIKKIKLKLYVPLSLFTFLVFSLFLNTSIEILVHFGVYLATLLNLYLLMYIIAKMFLSDEAQLTGKVDVVKVVIFFMIKVFIIFGALSLGVHFIGNKIIIPLINYVFQIFVLGISMRHNLK